MQNRTFGPYVITMHRTFAPYSARCTDAQCRKRRPWVPRSTPVAGPGCAGAQEPPPKRSAQPVPGSAPHGAKRLVSSSQPPPLPVRAQLRSGATGWLRGLRCRVSAGSKPASAAPNTAHSGVGSRKSSGPNGSSPATKSWSRAAHPRCRFSVSPILSSPILSYPMQVQCFSYPIPPSIHPWATVPCSRRLPGHINDQVVLRTREVGLDSERKR
jgi:hypothetical protein